MDEDVLTPLLDQCIEWHDVGSRVTCNPPPTDSDRDILCYVPPECFFVDAAIAVGFMNETDDRYQSALFASLRRGDVNLIVTSDKQFAAGFVLATDVCKKLNLAKREDRVTVFRAILYRSA